MFTEGIYAHMRCKAYIVKKQSTMVEQNCIH